MGLGYRIKLINEEKRLAQDKLIDIQVKMNQELEGKVKERTQLLMESNEELRQTVEELDITNETLNHRNREINKQHSKIQSSIQYAKRIQDAMLPSAQKLKTIFTDAFLLFMPRDVVSGDFYWISSPEKGTGKVVIAAVDCTGHGVPGAFMSLVGDGHLNQIVNFHQVYEPAEILSKLDLAIRTTLNQDEGSNKDGMDIAICTYAPQDQTLTYAGAKNPLVYFQEGSMKFLKGDKTSIGGKFETDTYKSFTQHQIDVSIHTTFFMFSDGFQDQFGGVHDKKFMISNFKKLLIQIHHLPCNEQQEKLQECINEWMAPNERDKHTQIDDILIIGAKI